MSSDDDEDEDCGSYAKTALESEKPSTPLPPLNPVCSSIDPSSIIEDESHTAIATISDNNNDRCTSPHQAKKRKQLPQQVDQTDAKKIHQHDERVGSPSSHILRDTAPVPEVTAAKHKRRVTNDDAAGVERKKTKKRIKRDPVVCTTAARWCVRRASIYTTPRVST